MNLPGPQSRPDGAAQDGRAHEVAGGLVRQRWRPGRSPPTTGALMVADDVGNTVGRVTADTEVKVSVNAGQRWVAVRQPVRALCRRLGAPPPRRSLRWRGR